MVGLLLQVEPLDATMTMVDEDNKAHVPLNLWIPHEVEEEEEEVIASFGNSALVHVDRQIQGKASAE